MKIIFELNNRDKWEFDLDDSISVSTCITELLRTSDIVKINNETVKDRFKEPQRNLTNSEWSMLG